LKNFHKNGGVFAHKRYYKKEITLSMLDLPVKAITSLSSPIAVPEQRGNPCKKFFQ
jgi:hypothetical protein